MDYKSIFRTVNSKTKFLPFLSGIVLLISCKKNLDLNYIKSKTWSYERGFKIGKGDFVLFYKNDQLFDLKHDTIFYKGAPRAIITDLSKEKYTMKVKSIDGKAIGEYRNPEESLEQ